MRDKLSDVEIPAEVNTQDTHVSLDLGNLPLLQRDNTKDTCVERNAQPASHYHWRKKRFVTARTFWNGVDI